MSAVRVRVPGLVDCTLLVWYVLDTPMVCFHAAGIGLLGYTERKDRPAGNGLVHNPGERWDGLGLGSSRQGSRTGRFPLAGKKEYETIAYPPGSPAASHLMLTIPQLVQAVNGNNDNSSSTRALIVHELANQLTLEDAITKGTWLQVFKDERAASPTLAAYACPARACPQPMPALDQAAPNQKTMILALCKFLDEEGNEELQREFHQKLVYGGKPNAKSFLQLISVDSTKKDKADVRSRLGNVWAALCAGVATTAPRTYVESSLNSRALPLSRPLAPYGICTFAGHWRSPAAPRTPPHPEECRLEVAP